MSQTRNIPRSCLLVGYCGNGNIGSDVRMLTIVEDLRATYGKSVEISIVSQNRNKTQQIIAESPTLRVVQIPFQLPPLFAYRIYREIARHDATILIEGSTFKDNWSRWLLYAYLWTVFAARMCRKLCVAYAVDVGEMTSFNRWLTAKLCSKMDLVITRTEIARDRLIEMGVTRPVFANTDTAFSYFPGKLITPAIPLRAADVPVATGRKQVGIAAVEFHQWPVRLRLFGPKSECYRWPYYFTWDDERREKSRRLAETYVRFITECVERHELDVTLIAMEELDREICERVLALLDPQVRARVDCAFSGTLLPAEMVPLLRSLDYLVTSRYHACVLSLAGAVPQMAIAHDERLVSIYQELGIDRHYLIDHNDPALEPQLFETFERLLQSGAELPKSLRKKHDEFFVPRCAKNRDDLADLTRPPNSAKRRKQRTRPISEIFALERIAD